MACFEDPKKGNYEFFDKVLEYIKKANEAESDHTPDNDYSCCDSFSKIWKSEVKKEENIKTICKQFIKLYKSLSPIKCKSVDGPNFTKECGFLNYWVNMFIREYRQNHNNCTNYFSNQMESHCMMSTFLLNELSDFLYDIKEDDFNKINILYNLYVNYVKLNAIDYKNGQQDKQQLLIHSTACCTDYIKASYICNHDNKKKNPIFCEKLEAFESKYKQLNQKVVEQGSDFSDYFIKLSECPNNKIITTAVTGTVVGLIPLLGVLYKFTPMGQMFRSNKGIVNNIISNNDDEITNISLMEHENEQLKFQKGKYNIKYQSL